MQGVHIGASGDTYANVSGNVSAIPQMPLEVQVGAKNIKRSLWGRFRRLWPLSEGV